MGLRREGLRRAPDDVRRVLLDALAESSAPARVDFAALDGAPPPLARYLRRVLRDGDPVIRRAELAQRGVLRTGPASRRWLDFAAEQLVAPTLPGFVWDARVRLPLGLGLTVRDSYAAGVGAGSVSFRSLRVGGDRDRPELAAGALHRFLAEAVWYPTALVPGPRLAWRPIAGDRALATLTDAGIGVSLEFRFDDDGNVCGIYTPARWGRFDRRYCEAGWEGRFREYAELGGLLVPRRGEVGWYVGERWSAVWRGEVTRARYAFD
jgi:hypothetical protein